eukprot:scaffold36250_cov57-Phaeocystis_antarctica.AAC.2
MLSGQRDIDPRELGVAWSWCTIAPRHAPGGRSREAFLVARAFPRGHASCVLTLAVGLDTYTYTLYFALRPSQVFTELNGIREAPVFTTSLPGSLN